MERSIPGLNRHDKDHMNRLKKVLSKEGTERWRSAAELYLYINPTVLKQGVKWDARTEALECAKEAAELRAATFNDFAVSEDKNSNRRHALHMPATMLQFIELIDPDLHSGNPQERRTSLRKLTKTFPEFSVMRRV